MMKKILLFVAVLCTTALLAENVEQNKAEQVAKAFAAQNDRNAGQLNADIVYAHPMPNKRDAAMYVVNLGESGFVIVSANDVAHPVLGYSFDRPWPIGETIPPQITDYLDDLAGQIESASNRQPDKATKAEWQELLSINPNNPPQPKGNRTQVGPLLTTTWDQGQYYNAMCPEDANGPDGHVNTGCVATAMAQIINYHQYPTSGRGTHSYQSNYGTLTVNYETETYDYTNMPDALTNESSEAQVNAVAQLMRDCGVAVNMEYTSGESGAYDMDARAALINFFRYSPDMSFAEKAFFSASEWNTMLQTELNASRPVYYSGRGSGGHAFVCDGYNSEDYFSFNFGWSGICNGWYLLDAVLGYNNNQAAILGITPDENGYVIIGQTKGNSYFDLDEPMEFYSSNGHNPYLSTEYSNYCQNQVVFTSGAVTNTLVVDVIYYEDQNVWFNTAIDWHCFLSPTATDFSPFSMTGNVASLDYTGYINSKGFALYIRHEDDCQIPNIAIARDLTSVCVVNNYYEPSMSWQVEYGLAGFTQGEGTLLNVESSEVTINNLTSYATYDIYARTSCETDQHSPWVKHTVELDPYWTDVVREQPSGYVVDANGNVEISSAEGLAWLSVLVNGFQGNQPNKFEGKTVTLTSDINIEGYRWYPMGRYLNWEWTEFSGTFDGQGHAISNIYVRDASSNLGLFGRVKKGKIRNVNMVGGSVSSTLESACNEPQYWLPSSCVGGLIGQAYHCYEISNCHSSVDVAGNGGAGSLCGDVSSYGQSITTKIYNCSSSGTVSGREVCGGLIGGVYGDVEIRNCYATGDVLITTCDYDAWEMGRGGLIGSFRQNPFIYNCFSTGIVYFDSDYNHPIGNIMGYVDQRAHINYLYGRDDVNQELDLFGSCDSSSPIYIADTSHFHHNGNINTLVTPLSINGVEQTELLDALNAWVTMTNDQNLKTWIIDTSGGFPVFGDYFEPSCYNPSDLIATNATVIGDTTISTQLSWTQIGEPDHWEVLFVAAEHNMDEGTIVSVNSNPCVLTDLTVGHPLDFYIRAICGDNDISGWSTPVTYIPDKLRWTEVVTSQPEGYVEGAEGNIFISSAEGLAWLSSVSNGLNGVQYAANVLNGKRIVIAADIDLSGYRWTSIASSWETVLRQCDIDGNNHTITGLYCNELEDHQGLFGCIQGGTISNLILKQCVVYGENYSGALIGEQGTNIINCYVTGEVYGIEYVGGLVGWHQSGAILNIINSGFKGIVKARRDITKANTNVGYVGGICGVSFDDAVTNCYVVSEIVDDCSCAGIIIGTGGRPNAVSNCYYKDYETDLPITSDNCIVENNSSFSGGGSTWTLNTPPYVNGAFRTDLLDALNAWVDANNTNGEYLHWVADTENVNGGFPMLEPVPSTTYQVQPIVQGWNWWSTYIEQEGIDGLTMLENSLGHNGLMIKTQVPYVQNYYPQAGYDYWFGSLTNVGLTNESCYQISVSSDCQVVMSGAESNPSDHPITIQPGWNWIGYPVATQQSLSVGLANYNPAGNDLIKGQGSSATYYANYGWFPTSFTLVPGQGYMYYSNATQNQTLTYNVGRGEEYLTESPSRVWTNDIHRYADNMTLIATVKEDGEEVSRENVELGAFVNGECRGSAVLQYFEPTSSYYAVLTISGEEGDRIAFGLVDRDTRTENQESHNAVTFTTDAVIGNLDRPYVVEFGENNAADIMTSMRMYPNPVSKNEAITLDIPENERVEKVIITDMLGRVIRCEAVNTNIIRGIFESGVYNIQVVTDKGIHHGKLMVK